MKQYSICVIKPDSYVHSCAFVELAELLMYSLRELGAQARIVFNDIDRDSRNILIGCHLLDAEHAGRMPASTIVLNTEQINPDDESGWSRKMLRWMSSFEVWDYSLRNIETMRSVGISHAKHLRIGFQKELARIEPGSDKEFDVLFYGCLNDRRQRVLDELSAAGLRVKSLFGIYGGERDSYISRSKIVLNHHYYETQIFEVVRVFYLLTNSIAVVGEVNDSTSIDESYRAAISAARYDELAARCIELANDPALVTSVAREGHERLSRCPQSAYTAALID